MVFLFYHRRPSFFIVYFYWSGSQVQAASFSRRNVMATTRIMPLHTGKGRTVRRAIRDIIGYVKNPEKTDDGRLVTRYACDSRTADAEFLLAKRQYTVATGRVRGK